MTTKKYKLEHKSDVSLSHKSMGNKTAGETYAEYKQNWCVFLGIQIIKMKQQRKCRCGVDQMKTTTFLYR